MNSKFKTAFAYIGMVSTVLLLAFGSYIGVTLYKLKDSHAELEVVLPNLIRPITTDLTYLESIWGENISSYIRDWVFSLGNLKSCPEEEWGRSDISYDPVFVKTEITCYFDNGKATFELGIFKENGEWKIEDMNVYLPFGNNI